MAVANNNSHNVSILLGNGDGTFATAVNYSAGSYAKSVAISDLDGDTVPDLAVANEVGSSVSILLGNGDGSFTAAVDFAVVGCAYFVAIGDLDDDTVPDLAVANHEGDNVSILIGNGDGTFVAPVIYGAGDAPYSLAIGDLDGDTIPDLAVANYYDGNVSILSGNGDGSFVAASNYGTGYSPYSVAIGDLDGDATPDLAVTNFHDEKVSVLVGNGDGSFAAAVSYGVGRFPFSVAIGDLDGDSLPDLAVANYLTYTASVLLNTSCDGSCVSDGICVANGVTDPTNECMVCDSGSGEFIPKASSTVCDDGLFCNGADTCGTGACDEHAGDPCAGAGQICNEDGDVCEDDETGIELISFDASEKNRSVLLTWETATEADNAGFHLLRSHAETGSYLRITTALVPARGSEFSGATYEFTDNGVNPGQSYWYKLEDVSINGTGTFHGPVHVTLEEEPEIGCGMVTGSEGSIRLFLLAAGVFFVSLRRRNRNM